MLFESELVELITIQNKWSAERDRLIDSKQWLFAANK